MHDDFATHFFQLHVLVNVLVDHLDRVPIRVSDDDDIAVHLATSDSYYTHVFAVPTSSMSTPNDLKRFRVALMSGTLKQM